MAERPIAPARIAEELRRMSAERQTRKLDHNEFEYRFSRMITELRERGIDGDRNDLLAALTPLRDEGVLTPDDWRRLTLQLGLT